MILLFDLDGTLTDPREGIVGSTKHALRQLGAEVPVDDVIASFIGPPLRGMFSKLLGGAPPERVEDAVRLYRERYRDVGVYETRRYPGVEAMVARAREAASRLLLATSKPWMFAERVLRHIELDGYFDAVYGPELDGTRDDKGELIAHLLREQEVAAEECLMIGDRSADVVAALANGVTPLGVLWGYGSEEELRGAGASRLFRMPAELAEAFAVLAAPEAGRAARRV